MDISSLLIAIRGLTPQLERFSIFDSLRNYRCLRIHEDSSRLKLRYALTFSGDLQFTGISMESIITFLLECSYVRTLSAQHRQHSVRAYILCYHLSTAP